MGLASISSWLATVRCTDSSAPVELLEAGCGTGRLLCQLAHNFPSFHFTALDLSPYYLDLCKDNFTTLQESSPTSCLLSSYMPTWRRCPFQAPRKMWWCVHTCSTSCHLL